MTVKRIVGPAVPTTMITSEHCQLMARYNEWMNSRLYALCASLSEAELRKDRGAFFKSVLVKPIGGQVRVI